MRDPKNTIRLKIIIKTGKIDTDYRNLMIGNPDISGHIRTYPDINGTLTGHGSTIFHIRCSPLQQEQMIIEYVKEHGTIRRSEVTDLCKITDVQAKHLLRRITGKYSQFQQKGVKRGTHYVWVD